MKKLVYQIEGYTGVYNPETKEVERVQTLAKISIPNPTNEEIERAAAIAYKGEYTIEDDGQPEPEAQSLEVRTAALEEALTLLLEGATE